MSKYIYGIDFGTSNSTLAVLDTTTNEVVRLFTTPSLIFFPKEQPTAKSIVYSVGTDAIDAYVRHRMQGRFMKSVKRVLPNKSFVDTKINGRSFKAEDLVAIIIKFLKKQADDFLGTTVTTAVIGRPVVFDERPDRDALAQERLEKATVLAGFEQYYFQFEPIGAAYTYERQITSRELVLVGDFGGGTSDFSLMYLDPAAIHFADRQKDMLAKGGIYIGGDSFDSDVMWHRCTPHFGRGVLEEFDAGKWLELPLAYFHNICSWEKMNFLDNNRFREAIKKSWVFSGHDYRVKNLQLLLDNNLGYLFFKEIERTKIHLTQHDTAVLNFDNSGIHITEEITLAAFENEIIHQNLGKIENYLNEFLEKQACDLAAVHSVFLTGGTSYIRPLQDVFKRKFGSSKIKSGDNFNSVALGLAYSYLNLK